MPINFDRLVLGPAMMAFASPIAVIPKEFSAPYFGRGDFREPNVQIQMDDGSLSTASPLLGIRRSEFAVLPRQGDEIYVRIKVNPDSPVGFDVLAGITRRFHVGDVQPDGEGDVKLILEEISSV